MSKVKVRQVKSCIGRPEKQRKVVKSLGLGRIGKTKELTDCATVRGMIKKVKHLIVVEGE